jgi:hypothetical protein
MSPADFRNSMIDVFKERFEIPPNDEISFLAD